MRKIISFSLWGDNPKYTVGAIRNAELALQIYPSWICYFFVSENVPKEIIDVLLSYENTIVFFKQGNGDWRSMFWRFETSYDPAIDISIFRDTDSRLSMREVYAVNQWLESDKTFHIMRDHPYHNFRILGGMWGFKKNPSYPYPMYNLLKQFKKTNEYGTDYKFFNEKLYPLIYNDKIVHDPFFDKLAFPTPREGTEFVGDVFDQNDVRHPEYHRHINGN